MEDNPLLDYSLVCEDAHKMSSQFVRRSRDLDKHVNQLDNKQGENWISEVSFPMSSSFPYLVLSNLLLMDGVVAGL